MPARLRRNEKDKAHAAVALAGISNQVVPTLAFQLIKLIDELIGIQGD